MKKYPYKAKIWSGPFATIGFGLLACFFYYCALNHYDFDYGHMHLEGSSAFYTQIGFSIFMALGFLLGLCITYENLFSDPKFIEINSLDITVPKTLFRNKTTIRFHEIVSIKERPIKKYDILTVKTANAKALISSALLKPEEYQEIHALLTEKWHQNKPG